MTKDKTTIEPDKVKYNNKKIIQSANIQERQGKFFFPKHIHQNIEIYYFIDGFCKMDIGKETILSKKGDIVIIFPNTVHSFFLDSNILCKFIHIHFAPHKLNSFFSNIENINLELLSILYSINNYCILNGDKVTISLLYSIVNETKKSTPFSETLCNLHLMELLINFMQKGNLSSLYLSTGSTNTSSYVFHAFQYIQKYYSEKILISDISNYLNISSRYLSKLFYEKTNLTVIQYINIYRINKAIDLMVATDNSLTDIALSVGLGDIQHFSKLFKTIIGINPRKYKQLLNN